MASSARFCKLSKRDREAAGALLAVAMLFGSNWVMPPPKPEFEEADKENADKDEGDDPDKPIRGISSLRGGPRF